MRLYILHIVGIIRNHLIGEKRFSSFSFLGLRKDLKFCGTLLVDFEKKHIYSNKYSVSIIMFGLRNPFPSMSYIQNFRSPSFRFL